MSEVNMIRKKPTLAECNGIDKLEFQLALAKWLTKYEGITIDPNTAKEMAGAALATGIIHLNRELEAE